MVQHLREVLTWFSLCWCRNREMNRRVGLHSVIQKQDIGALMHFLCSKATREQHSQMAEIITGMVPDYRPTPLPSLGHRRASSSLRRLASGKKIGWNLGTKANMRKVTTHAHARTYTHSLARNHAHTHICKNTCMHTRTGDSRSLQ